MQKLFEVNGEYFVNKEQAKEYRDVNGGHVSPLMNENHVLSFLVGNLDTKERYKITINIDEF